MTPRGSEEIYVEFDYRKRDALNHQAEIREYRKEELI